MRDLTPKRSNGLIPSQKPYHPQARVESLGVIPSQPTHIEPTQSPAQPLANPQPDLGNLLQALAVTPQAYSGKGGLTVNIQYHQNSHNVSDSYNVKKSKRESNLRYHQAQIERRPEKVSKLVGPFFFGAWLAVCLSIVVLGLGGGSNE